jgi:tRNA 2-thiouridine synthesizing protein A
MKPLLEFDTQELPSASLLDLAERHAALCRVLGNPRRLLMLWLLSEAELSVHEVAAQAGSSLQNVSQHLRLLRRFGLVTTRRDRQTIFYTVADKDSVRQCPALRRAPVAVEETTRITQSHQGETRMTADLSAVQAAKIVDARAMSCPGPLLEAKKGIATVKVGEVLEIWSGDANTKNDLPRWCEKVGHEFLGVLPGEGYERLFVRRAK